MTRSIKLKELIIARSEAMKKVLHDLEAAAAKEGPVLILGSFGTGKNTIAEILHDYRGIHSNRFVTVDCRSKSVNESISEAEDNSTLYLDEVDRCNEDTRSTVAEIWRNGLPRKKGIKVVVSTVINLEEADSNKGDSTDFSGAPPQCRIVLPDLRERQEDIGPLVRLFIKEEINKRRRSLNQISPKVFAAFRDYRWPGNINELKYVCRRLVYTLKENDRIGVSDLPHEIYSGAFKGRKVPGLTGKFETIDRLEDVMRMTEFKYINYVLEKFNWNQSHSARMLGIHRNTLLAKMKQLGIPLKSEKETRKISRQR